MNSTGESAVVPALGETKRQYRVAKQNLGIHAALRDRYIRISRFTERVLLIASVSLAVVSLSPANVLSSVGVTSAVSRYVLGVAALVAVVLSAMLVLTDWRERAIDHDRAVEEWTEVVTSFRRYRNSEGSWPREIRERLDSSYLSANQTTVDIPEDKFEKYKDKYRRKVEAAKIKDEYPAAPANLARWIVTIRDVIGLLFDRK